MNVDTGQFQALQEDVAEQHEMLAEMREALRGHMTALYTVLVGEESSPRQRQPRRRTEPREWHLRSVE